MRDICPVTITYWKFQSTPPVAEGRCRILVWCQTSDHAFQSTPPVAEGRCIRCEHLLIRTSEFQSTPPVAEGRCIMSSVIVSSIISFNPRPPLPRGDARRPADLRNWRLCFNPRPPLPRGDAILRDQGYLLLLPFQSTPPVAEGRCFASSVTRHNRKSFNPRPPLPRGDAAWIETRNPGVAVSIHAPRCRGAMPVSAPLRACKSLFQSTPPVAEGRCPLRGVDADEARSFNPRPPLPRGDALPAAVAFDAGSLFQSTPPVAEGRCTTIITSTNQTGVSIHAPRCRGAMPGRGKRRLPRC